jgi:hypothetical protein
MHKQHYYRIINVKVAKLGSSAGKFLIWKESGGGARERKKKR